MKQYFSMYVPENLKVLLKPNRIPKIHRSPIGSEFIVASKQCVIKTLSKNIAAGFKLTYKSVKKCSIKISVSTELTYFGWFKITNQLLIIYINLISINIYGITNWCKFCIYNQLLSCWSSY